jgi:fatty acid synthase
MYYARAQHFLIDVIFVFHAGNGYVRSEAAVVVVLQRRRDARRIYSTVLHAKTNTDGYKQQGVTYPSGEMQKRLLVETYSEADVDPSKVAYVEAHGTGTKVGIIVVK